MLFKKLKIEKLQQQPTDSTSQQQGSEGKLTVAKRIRSSLKVMKQSSLSELATICSSPNSDSLNGEGGPSDNREASNTASEQNGAKYVRTPEWFEGQGSLPSQLPAPSCPVNSDTKLLRNTSIISTSALQSQERPSLTFVSTSPEKQLPEPPWKSRLAAVSASKLGGSGSVVGKLARSLSECDRKALISELQLSNPLQISSSSDTEVGKTDNPKQNNEEPNTISQPMCTSKQTVQTSDMQNAIIKPPHHKHLQSDTTTKKVQGQHEVVTSTSLESEGPSAVGGKGAKTVESTEEQALAEEQKALTLLMERREAEEMVAQLSRERMNSMLSEEEIAEVCQPK